MNADSIGGMEFIESMIALIAVTAVLAGFLAMVATTVPESNDPCGDLDGPRFTGKVEDGSFVPSFTDYLASFIDSRGLSGCTVSVSIPGGFAEVDGPIEIGQNGTPISSKSFSSVIVSDDGRSFPAFFEVVLFA